VHLRPLPPELVALLGLVLVVVAVVQALGLALRKYRGRSAIERARARGADGEIRAEDILRRSGYRIVGRQVARRYGVGVDGKLVPIDLRADFLVARNRARFVVEVKTGRLAPRIDTPATRRQLLEYRLAFDVDGVLLVDAEADCVHCVVFPLPLGHPSGTRLASAAMWLAVGVLLGSVAVARFGGP
jgi:hypothetical protein